MENPPFGPICRTCMSNGQDFHSILEYENVSKLRISEMLMASVPQLHVQPGADRLPVLICAECLNKLNIAFHYQQLCIQTDRSLKAMLLHNGEDADGEHQQQEDHLDMETKQIEVLLLKETAPDPLADSLMHNADTLLLLNDSCIKIENESECEEFLYNNPEDKDGIFKPASMYTTTTRTEEDDNDEIDIKPVKVKPKTVTATLSQHNETDVDQIEKPDVRYRKGRYLCPDCLKNFDTPFLLRRHSVVHSITRPHECDICKYRFVTETHLKRHRNTHNSEASAKIEAPAEGYKCPDCPRRFVKCESLSAHLGAHRRANPQQIFQCEYCPKKFKKYRHLTQHARAHPENQKFKCNLCDKAFALNSRLIEHLEKHSGLKKYKCTHCDRAFPNNTVLKEHMNTHTGETPYLCQQCGKSFAHRSTMRQHMQRHSDEKRYCCKECPSKFACQSDQIKHMSVHRTNAHTCDICGSSFSRSYSLKNHKKIHTGKRPYKCGECNMSFVLLGIMQRHMRTHTGHKPHKCKYCDRAYAASADLNKHLRTHIGENTYMCDECPKAFKYKKELQLHKIQHFKQAKLESESKTAIVSAAETGASPTSTTSKEVTFTAAVEPTTIATTVN